MKSKKQGISLVTLVITIIVMIIIAGVIIFQLNDTNIFDKANEAVTKTNLNQIQTILTLAWSEAYLEPEITTDEQYKEYVEKKLKDNGINPDKYVLDITSKGAKVEGPDLTKPTITLTADRQGVGVGGTLTYTVIFNDNKEVTSIDFDADDINLTGFTATINLTGEGNTKTLTLGNIQGELGEKTVTIAAGVAKDVAGNVSNATTVKFSVVETLGTLITSAEMYGTKVNYEANGITDWKVFYNQEVDGEEYVYLIASEGLTYDKVPEILTETIENGGANAIIKSVTLKNNMGIVGNIYWDGDKAPASVATIQNPELWMAEWGNYDSYSTNENGRCISYFLDENIWESFKNTTKYIDSKGESYVKGAIGTPTAEMFIASWNTKREATGNTTKYNKKLKLVPNGTQGYYVNDITTSETASSNMAYQGITTSDKLYIWCTEYDSNIWLASPASSNSYVLYVGMVGVDDAYYRFNNIGAGVRPVVCLSADIPASVDADGNFVI